MRPGEKVGCASAFPPRTFFARVFERGSGALTKHLVCSFMWRFISAPRGCFDPIPPALHLPGHEALSGQA